MNINQLSILRKRARTTQIDLAKKSGVSQATISRLESGSAVNPTVRTVERIESALRHFEKKASQKKCSR